MRGSDMRLLGFGRSRAYPSQYASQYPSHGPMRTREDRVQSRNSRGYCGEAESDAERWRGGCGDGGVDGDGDVGWQNDGHGQPQRPERTSGGSGRWDSLAKWQRGDVTTFDFLMQVGMHVRALQDSLNVRRERCGGGPAETGPARDKDGRMQRGRETT